MQDKFNSLYPYRNTPGLVTYRLYRFRDDRSGCRERGELLPDFSHRPDEPLHFRPSGTGSL